MFLEFTNLVISNKKGKINEEIQNLPFLYIKEKILGKKYDLSVNFISPKDAQDLNKKYRSKDYIPNILSFPLSEKSGEIFICLSVAKKEYNKFDLNYINYLKLLLVHGCLHLSGIDHGDEMEKLEEKYLTKFLI
jgi:probable rRNA maturation factor